MFFAGLVEQVVDNFRMKRAFRVCLTVREIQSLNDFSTRRKVLNLLEMVVEINAKITNSSALVTGY